MVASGDVLYDLAFLLMDIVERDLTAAANTVLNGYFAACRRIEDCDGLAALPFFMSLRAAIRAKVTAARLKSGANDDKLATSARRYFDLALEVLKAEAPQVIGVGGLSGTGKTALARSLAPLIAPRPGALLLRSEWSAKRCSTLRRRSVCRPRPIGPKCPNGSTSGSWRCRAVSRVPAIR